MHRLRRQAYLTRYVALGSVCMLAISVLILYWANVRFVNSNTKLMKSVYELGSYNTTIAQSLSTALDRPINHLEVFGIYALEA